jgi:hypothetical protein
MKMEQTKVSETLAFKLQTPGNHPEESIRHTKKLANGRKGRKLDNVTNESCDFNLWAAVRSKWLRKRNLVSGSTYRNLTYQKSAI